MALPGSRLHHQGHTTGLNRLVHHHVLTSARSLLKALCRAHTSVQSHHIKGLHRLTVRPRAAVAASAVATVAVAEAVAAAPEAVAAAEDNYMKYLQ